MKTLVTRWSRTRHFNFPTAFVVLAFAVAALALPLYSVNSSSLGVKAPGVDAEGKAPVSANSKFWFPSFAPLAGETVELYAADCTTPKTDFNVGEIVCAKTNGVDLSVANNHYMNWIDSQLNSTNGGTITQNPQLFLFAAPTAGTWKATIGRVSPADSSIIGNPPLFTVSEGLAVATFASNCTTPKTAFVLGETVCVKVSGLAVNASFPNRIAWTDPAGVVRSRTDITADPQSDTFPLGNTVDNRGTWQANITRNNGRRITSAPFTVSDPQQAVADVYVQKFNRDPDQAISSGGSAVFILVVGNSGPDAAQSVALADSFPAGLTLASFTQQSGPACLPASTGNCTMGTLKSGERAEFTAIYNTGTVGAGLYSTSATVSSSTADSNNNNNSSTAEFEIAAGGGGSQCTLTCPTSPAPVNNEPGQNGATVDWNGPNNDNIPVATGTSCGAVTVSAASPAFFSIGSTPVTVTTESGEECTFTVTVRDVEDPNVGNCPANITVTEDSGTPGSAIVNYATPSATDNSGDVTVTCDQPSGSTFSVTGSPHTVTCTASDAAGNTDSCTFTVTVNPTSTDCTLTPPANITVNSDATQCGANVTYTAPTESGTCGTVTCDRPSGSFFPGGTTVVTCSDGAGATTSFTVTVNDTTAPVVDPLPTLTGECSVTAGVPVTIDPPGPPPPFTVIELPKATDNCGGSISASTQNERTYTLPGTYVVNWTYTDASGNMTTQQQTVIVTGTDNSAPVPDVATLPTATGECQVEPPTATDNCAGTVTGTTTDLPVGAGTHTVVWTYDDGRGNVSQQNQTVVITDTQAPTISCPANISVNNDAGLCSATVNPGTATATDNCAINLTTVVGTRSDNQSLNAPYPVGTTTITWTATDSGNNSASCAQTITVTDNTEPVVTPPSAVTLYTGPGATSCSVTVTNLDTTLGTGSATDNCAGVGAVSRSGVPAGNVFPEGQTTLTYSATDAYGNTGTATQVVTVIDNTAPVLNAPADVVDYTGSGATACNTVVTDLELGTATASDNCPGIGSIMRAGVPAGNVFPVGETIVTYTVTDAHNNTTTKTQKVTVVDNTPPTITCPTEIVGHVPGSNFVLEPTCPSGAIATFAAAVVGDNCGVANQTETTSSPIPNLHSGSVFPIGMTTVTRTVTDIHGNTASCSFTVTVRSPLEVVDDLKLRVQALQPPLSGTQVQGLQSKLEAARLAIIAGQTNVACNKLADFISQVQAYINNGKLTSAQGQPLINSAAKVRNTLGCTNNPCS